MSRIPVGLSASKRRLDSAFDDTTENQAPGSHKKPNVSLPCVDPDRRKTVSSFETHMYQADLKELQIKIVSLEQDLMLAQNEQKRLEIEASSLTEKHKIEIRNMEEHKRELEKALKNSSKMNEEFIKSELEQVRTTLDTEKSENGPQRTKQISSMKEEIQRLNEELHEKTSAHEKELMDLQYEIESKGNQINEHEHEIANLKEKIKSLAELPKELEKAKLDICRHENKIHDLESENRSLKDNAENFHSYVDQTQQIESLQRENRKLQAEVDYFKTTQEKIHLYEEEIIGKDKTIKNLEQILVSVQLQNSELQEQMRKMSTQSSRQNMSDASATVAGETMIDDTVYIAELEDRVTKYQERNKFLAEEIRKLKQALNEKDESINALQQNLARINSERNSYQRIIDNYDADRTLNDETRPLYKRIDEMENLLKECKNSFGDAHELKLCNNTTFRLEKGDVKCTEVQVNLNEEIYAKYEAKIVELKKEVHSLKQRNQALEDQLKTTAGASMEQFEALMRENVALKKAAESNASNSPEFEKLKQDFEQQKIMNSRLMTEFEKQTRQILHTMRQLIGFKIVIEEDTVKLISRLNPEHFLLFKINADKSMRLMETEFANYYPNFVDIYLKEHHSIPSFISAIVLDSKGFKVDTSM